MSTREVGAARLRRLPPYLFAQIERKIAEKRAAGVDVISLGIGDPDRPTPDLVVRAMQEQVARPDTHQYPSNRGRASFRASVAGFYARRFGVELDPEHEIVPALGAKEAIASVNLAFLDPGDVALASDPGYPVYTTGPILAGAEPVALPLVPELGFQPDLDAIPEDVLGRARLIFLNYPNNPTGGVVEGDLFARVVELARAHDLIVVHDNAYSEITYDGYVAPSFLATPGAKDVGIEVFSLSKTYNMTGWRVGFMCGNTTLIAALARMKSYLDYGMFTPIQVAAIAALEGPQDCVGEIRGMYQKRRDVLCDGLNALGWHVQKPKATMFVWAPIPEPYRALGSLEFCKKLLAEAKVAVSPGIGFGEYGDDHVRFGLIENEHRTRQALRGIREMFRKDSRDHYAPPLARAAGA